MGLILKRGTLVDGSYVANLDIDGTKAYIPDSTGLYDVDDNPGGYGTPNPDRVNVAWILVVQYMGTSETEDITPEAYTPTSATQITIPITKDGHIQVNGFLINVIAGGENDGDYGYDTADDKVKLLTLGVWVEVTDLTTLLTVDGLVSNILHIPVIVQASKKKNDVNKERFDKIITGEHDEGRNANDRIYTEIKGRLEQGSNNFCAGNHYEFQRIIEALNKFIIQFGV